MSLYTPSFSQVFSGVILKIIADGEHGMLYVETRDGEKRKVHFHGINLSSKKIHWTDLSVLDPWWCSLKAVGKGNLLFVAFNEPDMPEQRGFAVVDGKSGKLKWGKPDAQVMHTEPDFIIISKDQDENNYLKVDWNTGAVSKEVSLKELFTNFNRKKSAEEATVLYPFHFDEENSFFNKIQQYIEILTQHKAIRMIEYLEKGDKVLISYYIYEGEKLTNFILVADENGTVLVHDKLKEGLSGIGMDTFFVMNNELVVVKNNNELCAYVIK
jgi:hypothetical protein